MALTLSSSFWSAVRVSSNFYSMAARLNPSPSERSARSFKGARAISPLRAVARASLMIVLAAAASAVSQLSLSPVYGSIPASLLHRRAVNITIVLAFVIGSASGTHSRVSYERYLPVVASWSQPIQYLLSKRSSRMGPTYGPLITEALTCLPLLFIATHAVKTYTPALGPGNSKFIVAESAYAIISYVTFASVEGSLDALLPRFMGTSDFFTRSGLQLAVALASSVLSPSSLLFLMIPAILHTVLLNPHHPAARTTALLNSTLQSHEYTLLERKESLTGYISVLESAESQFRVLRCDHSLLGGDWLVTPTRRAQGQTVREPIYQVFTMLEAVRLVETGDSPADSEKSALVM